MTLLTTQATTLHMNITKSVQFSLVAQSCPTLCNPMDCSMLGFLVHHQHLELVQCHVHRVNLIHHPPISSSVIPFSSCLKSFSASGSLLRSQFFPSRLKYWVSAPASVLPMNIQDWFPLGWTGWISLQSKGPCKVFSNTTVQKHQFFSTQLCLQSNSHIHTWLLEKP